MTIPMAGDHADLIGRLERAAQWHDMMARAGDAADFERSNDEGDRNVMLAAAAAIRALMREAPQITEAMVTAALSAYHGERYARDYEYIDANLRTPMRAALDAALAHPDKQEG